MTMMIQFLLTLSCLLLPSFDAFGILSTRGQRRSSSSSIINSQSVVLHAATTTSIPESPQLLEFEEPQTGTKVVLVGAMHYNPASVKLASETVEELGKNDQLGSVIVESCQTRWNNTYKLYEEKPFLKDFLGNEMRTASDMAITYNRPVVLGDQCINITGDALKKSLKDTFIDFGTPFNGWKRVKEDISEGLEETAILGGEGYLGPNAILDPKLVLSLPVSLIKYPLSFLVRDPLVTSIFLTFFAASTINDIQAANNASPEASVGLVDYLTFFGVAALETIVFARLLLKPLLAERNLVLAKSILDQCRIFGESDEQQEQQQSISNEIIYARDSPRDDENTSSDGNNNNNNKVVVAVLGMAHCNGIMKILQEQQVR